MLRIFIDKNPCEATVGSVAQLLSMFGKFHKHHKSPFSRETRSWSCYICTARIGGHNNSYVTKSVCEHICDQHLNKFRNKYLGHSTLIDVMEASDWSYSGENSIHYNFITCMIISDGVNLGKNYDEEIRHFARKMSNDDDLSRENAGFGLHVLSFIYTISAPICIFCGSSYMCAPADEIIVEHALRCGAKHIKNYTKPVH